MLCKRSPFYPISCLASMLCGSACYTPIQQATTAYMLCTYLMLMTWGWLAGAGCVGQHAAAALAEVHGVVARRAGRRAGCNAGLDLTCTNTSPRETDSLVAHCCCKKNTSVGIN
jgi:hypothetical protein